MFQAETMTKVLSQDAGGPYRASQKVSVKF